MPKKKVHSERNVRKHTCRGLVTGVGAAILYSLGADSLAAQAEATGQASFASSCFSFTGNSWLQAKMQLRRGLIATATPFSPGSPARLANLCKQGCWLLLDFDSCDVPRRGIELRPDVGKWRGVTFSFLFHES